MCFAILWLLLLDFRAYSNAQKPKTCRDKKKFAILSFTSAFTVKSGTVWRQDLAILSPEGSRDSTFQLRMSIAASVKVKSLQMQMHILGRINYKIIYIFFQKRPFVHNSVCSQRLEGWFAILAECSQFCLRSS